MLGRGPLGFKSVGRSIRLRHGQHIWQSLMLKNNARMNCSSEGDGKSIDESQPGRDNFSAGAEIVKGDTEKRKQLKLIGDLNSKNQEARSSLPFKTRDILKGNRDKDRDEDRGEKGNSMNGRIEAPIPALLLILMCVCVLWANREEGSDPNEITYSEFLERFLAVTEQLEVVNKSHVVVHIRGSNERVVFRIGNHSNLEMLLLKYLHSQREYLPQPQGKTVMSQFALAEDETFTCTRRKHTQSDLHSYSASEDQNALAELPPIRYVDRIEMKQVLKHVLPTVILTAASFITLTKPARDVFSSMPLSNSQSSNQSDKILRFGKVTPVLGKEIPLVRFSNVAGLAQAKKEVSEFVDFLKQPQKYHRLGAEIPKGALLIGPPGTGKTLLAKAIAGEAGVPFYSTSGSDFMELFVGIGASRVRDLFEKARQSAPSIVFIDEIDTIGRTRSSNASFPGGGDEREATLNALLVELDGFSSKNGVVVLAGTNRADVLDPALTRPGRFDRQIALSKPTLHERKEIFLLYLAQIRHEFSRKLSLTPGEEMPVVGGDQLSGIISGTLGAVCVEQTEREDGTVLRSSELKSVCPGLAAFATRLSELTPGLTGAEIKQICNEAAIYAARRNGDYVNAEDFEEAIERLVGGLRNEDRANPEVEEQVAFHEAGHAVVGWLLGDNILRMSIVPRQNGALGYTQTAPRDSDTLLAKEQLLDRICVLLGGRASEHLFTKTTTTGCSDDLSRATTIARNYFMKFGFDSELGLTAMSDDHGFTTSGRNKGHPISQQTKTKIDSKIQRILQLQWERSIRILKENETELRTLVKMLQENKSLSHAQIANVLGPKPQPFVLAPL